MNNRLDDYTLEIYIQDGEYRGALMLPGLPAETIARVARQRETLVDDKRRIFVLCIGGKYPLDSIVTLARNWRSSPAASGWTHVDLTSIEVKSCYARSKR